MQQDAAIIVQKELTADEHLVWTGKPRQGVVFRPSDVLMIPFSLFWCGFAVFWLTAAMRAPSSLMWIAGIPFVAVGLYLVFGRFICDAVVRAKILYGLTNQRVLIITGRGKVKSLDLRRVTEINLAERKNRSGIITFGPIQGETSWLTLGDWTGSIARNTPKFENIENVRQVYEIVLDLQKKLS